MGRQPGWRRENQTGLADQWVPYAALGTVIFVSCFTLGILGRGDVQIAGPPMAVAIGYMGFAILDRQLVLGLLALAMAAVVVAVLALDPGHPYSVQSFVTGTGTFLAGLALRRAERPGGVTA